MPTGRVEGFWELYLRTGPKSSVFVRQGLVETAAEGDRIEMYLPVGDYRIQINSFDPVADKGLEIAIFDLSIPPGEGSLDLPPARLATRLGNSLVGKPAPEIDAKDLDKLAAAIDGLLVDPPR